jgi:ribose transport system substrate-binding protein
MPQGTFKTRVSLRSGVALVAIALGSPASAREVKFSDAERTPAKCDSIFKVSEMESYKAPKAKRPYRIEFSVPSLANPYHRSLIFGAQQAAKDAGVTLNVDAGRGYMDPAAQITQLENALTHRPDALLINPANPDGMAPTIDEAIHSGIPTIDVGTLSNSAESMKLVMDDFTQGAMAAQALAKLDPEGGQGIVMAGPPADSWARRRTAGFLEELKKYPNIKVAAVVNSDLNPQAGLTKFIDAAQAHPKFDYVYVTSSFVLEPPSIPAEYRKATYVAGSLDKVTLAALKDGSAAAVLPDFSIFVGYLGLSLAVQKLNGDNVPQHNCSPVAAMFKDDASNPVWVNSNIPPADTASVK